MNEEELLEFYNEDNKNGIFYEGYDIYDDDFIEFYFNNDSLKKNNSCNIIISYIRSIIRKISDNVYYYIIPNK